VTRIAAFQSCLRARVPHEPLRTVLIPFAARSMGIIVARIAARTVRSTMHDGVL
jgi:hypothetical protein